MLLDLILAAAFIAWQGPKLKYARAFFTDKLVRDIERYESRARQQVVHEARKRLNPTSDFHRFRELEAAGWFKQEWCF